MDHDYLPIPGRRISSTELTIDRAQALALFLESRTHAFAQLVEIIALDANDLGTEAVVFDVEIERGQRVVNDIRRHERIAVICTIDDDDTPVILALRPTFPRDVSHLYLYDASHPPHLCVYEEPWDEVRLSWTPMRFVERIRGWLARTAAGTLHAEDQPLPPFLLGTYSPLILPLSLLAETDDERPYYFSVRRVDGGLDRSIYIIDPVDPAHSNQNGVEHLATIFRAEPQEHRSLQWRPNSLADLHDITEPAKLDLLVQLRTRLRAWQLDPEIGEILDLRLMLVVVLPRLRAANDAQSEWPDIWSFATTTPIRNVGDRIDAWQIQGDSIGRPLVVDKSKRGQDVDLVPLRLHFALAPTLAALYSGLDVSHDPTIAAVGAGALGSQVFMNLTRMGWGSWTLIDDDYILPHNLVRHALDGTALGLPKAKQLGSMANSIFPFSDSSWTESVVANVLYPREQSEHLAHVFEQASIILDLSASVPVARYLDRDVASNARRVSLFLNPAGSDLVLLAEDAARLTKLDSLEMQYYRALVTDERLSGHLHREVGPIRYAQACRDVSAVLAQDRVALHAAIGSRAVREMAGDDSARGSIWRTKDDGCVTRCDLPVHRTIEAERSPWRVVSDEGFLAKIARQRLDHLPNETGGVLIGAFDLERKVIFVADMIPSPPDSQEWPTTYVRGFHGLRECIDDIQNLTHHMLEYVGEWHSHPETSLEASDKDRMALAWLREMMGQDGLPALMLIAGANGHEWYVEGISST